MPTIEISWFLVIVWTVVIAIFSAAVSGIVGNRADSLFVSWWGKWSKQRALSVAKKTATTLRKDFARAGALHTDYLQRDWRFFLTLTADFVSPLAFLTCTFALVILLAATTTLFLVVRLSYGLIFASPIDALSYFVFNIILGGAGAAIIVFGAGEARKLIDICYRVINFDSYKIDICRRVAQLENTSVEEVMAELDPQPPSVITNLDKPQP